MKKLSFFKILFSLIAFFALTGFATTSVKADTAINRYYNSALGIHEWADPARLFVIGASFDPAKAGYTTEGIAWYAPATGTKVYLLSSPTGDTLLTTSVYEATTLANEGWTGDWSYKTFNGNGTQAFYSGGEVPVYRLYNPNAGNHFFTANVPEEKSLLALGWKLEGIGFYEDKGGI